MKDVKMSDNLNELDKVKLTGRIYPAIKSCVDNRYKIVIGFFAYYAFILNVKIETIKANFQAIQIIMSIIFTLFVFHNYYNYARNADELQKIEKLENPTNWFSRSILEFIFGAIMIIIIWLAFAWIKLDC